MTKNKLHINMSKSVRMHFKHSLSISDRLVQECVDMKVNI